MARIGTEWQARFGLSWYGVARKITAGEVVYVEFRHGVAWQARFVGVLSGPARQGGATCGMAGKV